MTLGLSHSLGESKSYAQNISYLSLPLNIYWQSGKMQLFLSNSFSVVIKMGTKITYGEAWMIVKFLILQSPALVILPVCDNGDPWDCLWLDNNGATTFTRLRLLSPVMIQYQLYNFFIELHLETTSCKQKSGRLKILCSQLVAGGETINLHGILANKPVLFRTW